MRTRSRLLSETKIFVLVCVLLAGVFTSPVLAELDQQHVSDLLERLQSSEVLARRDAARELGEIGADSQPVVDALAKLLDEKDDQVFANAIGALSRIGPKSISVLPKLIDMADESGDQDRYRIAYAMGAMGPDAVGPLRDALRKSKNDRRREAMIRALGWIGNAAHKATPELIKHLGEDEELSNRSVETLAKIGPQVVEPLVPLLKSDDANLRRAAMRVFTLFSTRDVRFVDQIRDHLSDDDADVRAEAVSAFAKHCEDSAESCTTLAATLKDENETVRQRAIAGLVRKRTHNAQVLPQVLQLLENGKEEDAKLAIFFVSRLGDRAAEAVEPILVALEKFPDLSSEVSLALTKIGTGSIAPLLKQIASQKITSEATRQIWESLGSAAAPILNEKMASGSLSEKVAAAKVVGYLRPLDPTILKQLTKILDGESVELRVASAKSLGNLGAEARSTEASLRVALRSQQPKLQAAAIEALFKIGTDPNSLSNEVVLGLKSDAVEVRRQAASSLSKLDSIEADQVEAIVVALADSDAEVRAASAKALANSKEISKQAVEALVKLLHDQEEAVCIAAIQTLGRHPNGIDVSLRPLTTLMAEPNPKKTLAVLSTLRKFGPAAAAANEQLLQLLDHKSDSLRAATLRTLSATESNQDLLIKILTGKLSDDEWSVRKRAAELLADVGPSAVPAVPELLKRIVLRDDEDFAGDALRKIDASSKEAVPQLIEILKNRRSRRRARFFALHLLKKSGPAAKDALPTLNEMLEKRDLDSRAKRYIRSAIEEIEKQ